jgi:hypothetical protein
MRFDSPTSPTARGNEVSHDEAISDNGQAGTSANIMDIANTTRKSVDGSVVRARKGMLREATVVLQCILATVSEQEEAHEALVALLRLKDGDLCNKDAEIEKLRQRLKERCDVADSAREWAMDRGRARPWAGPPCGLGMPRSRCIPMGARGGCGRLRRRRRRQMAKLTRQRNLRRRPRVMG